MEDWKYHRLVPPVACLCIPERSTLGPAKEAAPWRHLCHLGKVSRPGSPSRDRTVAPSVRPARKHTAKPKPQQQSSEPSVFKLVNWETLLCNQMGKFLQSANLCDHVDSRIPSSTVAWQSLWAHLQGARQSWFSPAYPSTGICLPLHSEKNQTQTFCFLKIIQAL